jgi:diadenosine tetraphosphate (Ap4A) HIT family hydrolase
MSLEHLWAGWRAAYVESVPSEMPAAPTGAAVDVGGESSCVFCRIIEDPGSDEERGIVARTAHSVALLNAYPYASGHVLVMPVRHVQELGELSADEAVDSWQVTLRAAAAIQRAYQPDGLNIGANLGRAAGAGIPAHLHLHVVPRWLGDTNFMTTVASVRVLPEPLPRTWAKLRHSWESAGGGQPSAP